MSERKSVWEPLYFSVSKKEIEAYKTVLEEFKQQEVV